MKYFNTLAVAAWFAMFALSLRPISTDAKEWSALENLTVNFNETVQDMCESCTRPTEPVTEYNVADGKYEGTGLEDLPTADNRITQAILMNTFPLVMFAMLALNLGYYVGNGTIGRTGRGMLRTIPSAWKKITIRRKSPAAEEPASDAKLFAEES